MIITHEQSYYNAYNKGPVILQWLLQIISYITMRRTNGNCITMIQHMTNYITILTSKDYLFYNL